MAGIGDPLIAVENEPLAFDWLARALDTPDEVNAVWPGANFPLQETEWRCRFLDHPDNRSVFLELDGRRVGHAGLMGGDEPDHRHLAHFFLLREDRGRGLGRPAVRVLEEHARDRLGCRRMTLKTNDWNPRAVHLYTAMGYEEEWRKADILFMSKDLVDR